MRLIDADKLEELCDIMAEKCGGIGESIWNQFRTTVEWSPTVDVVDVVRCKDCVHWGSSISQVEREQCASQGVDLVCSYWESDGLYAEDFCSYGEHKERSEDE